MDEAKLTEVCFSLAENLMWEKDTAPIERLPAQLAELSETTNKLVHIAKESFYLVEDLPNSEQILFGAISYLNALAIPPLRGNYPWFFNSLNLLLELCNPNSGVGKDGIPFLLNLQRGVFTNLEWAIQDKEKNI